MFDSTAVISGAYTKGDN